jgi:integrase
MPKKNPKMRADGRYRKTVSVRKQTGSKKPKPIYARTPDELEEKYIEFKHKMIHGDITDPGNLTVAGYLETWLNTHKRKISPLTADGYENYIFNHIKKDDFGSMFLKDLKPMHVEAYYASELERDRGKDKDGKPIKGFSGKTILQEHRILHKAFKQAVRNELISKNPCDYVDVPRAEEYQVKIYNEDKFNTLLNNVENTPDELPILLAGMCGLRRSEVFGLNWSDIDTEEGKISVNRVAVYNKEKKEWILKDKPKNQTSRRTFIMPSEIIPVFKRKKGIGLVCCKEDGGIVNGGTFSHHFSDLLEKYDLPHIRFHDLRHFNATMMLKYGVSDKEAARRLGHATPNTLRKTYQHHIDELDSINADKLNSIIHKKSIEGQTKGQA